jgi:DNA-binding MarR family transcriptional regulator
MIRLQPEMRVVKQSTLGKDAQNLHEAISELVRAYQFRDRKRTCYYDLSVTQCYAVAALVAHGPTTLNSLAAKLYLDKSTASRVVDSLEQKGYVRRAIDPEDARALKLEITSKGSKLHSKIENDLIDDMRTLLKDVDPQVRSETTRLVSRLAEKAKRRFSEKGILGKVD